MAFVELQNLQKTYGAHAVVHDFVLNIERGEFVSFLGPSGCGKTTTLRMVAGFEPPSAGKVFIDGKDVTNLHPSRRNVGMVFQSYALFPNLTVADNIAFGMKVAKKPVADIRLRVGEMLEMIKLPQLGNRFPYQLSGGQQQRVALARAIAVKPQVLLLDEPLSALDAKIRISLREEIRSLQRTLGITTIYVTHDQEEALSMSDRIVVMNEGKADQIGTPFEIYNRPQTRFVASFVGTLNQLKATRLEGNLFDVDGQHVRAGVVPAGIDSAISLLALRPEAVSLTAETGRSNQLNGTIDEVHFLGSVVRIRVKFGTNTVSFDTFNSPSAPPPARGSQVALYFSPDDVLVLT